MSISAADFGADEPAAPLQLRIAESTAGIDLEAVIRPTARQLDGVGTVGKVGAGGE